MQKTTKTAIVTLITFILMMTLVSSFTAISFAAEGTDGKRITYPQSGNSLDNNLGCWPNDGGVSLDYNASSAAFNMWSTVPKTAHVLWTGQIGAGGLIGGFNLENGFFRDSSVCFASNGACEVAGHVYTAHQVFSSVAMNVLCYDAETGKLLWTSPNLPTTSSNMQVIQMSYKESNTGQGNTVAILSGSTIYFLDGETGQLWRTHSLPAGALNLAYGWNDTTSNTRTAVYGMTSNELFMYGAATINPRLSNAYCFQLTSYTGAFLSTPILMWNVTFPGEARYSFYTYSDVIVSPDYGTFCLRGFDRWSGRVLWQIPFIQYNTPSLGYDKVFCGGEDNYLYCFDLHTGAQLWRSETPLNSFFNQHCHCVGNGLVVSIGYDGTTNAWDVNTGKLVWRYYIGDCQYEPFKSWYGTYVYNQEVVGGINAFVSATGDHMGTNPTVPGETMTVWETMTGDVMWQYPLFASQHNNGLTVADGMLFALDAYTNQLFCFGKGPSAVTVSVSQPQIAKGEYVWITGTVTDQSAGQKDTPCVSTADMSGWMQYLHSSFPVVTNKHGVTLTLYAQGSDGNTITIGDVTTNGDNGEFAMQWVPPAEGMYTITGVFLGDDSYWTSNGDTHLAVGPQAVAPTSSSSSTTAAISIASLAAVAVGAVVFQKRSFKNRREETRQ